MELMVLSDFGVFISAFMYCQITESAVTAYIIVNYTVVSDRPADSGASIVYQLKKHSIPSSRRSVATLLDICIIDCMTF